MRTYLFLLSISLLLAGSAQAQAPTFTSASVLNAASMTAGPIAPGMVVAITGSNLGSAPPYSGNCQTSGVLPATCSAVNVLVNGSAAPKLFDSSTEVTFQAPTTLTGSTATIQVTSNLSGATLSSAVVTVPVAPTAPGIFTANGSGTGTGYYLVNESLFPQYSVAVQAGQTVVLYATGFGVTSPAVATGALGPNSPASVVATVTMTISGQNVPVTAELEPGNSADATIGYDEVVFTVPSGLPIPLTATQANPASLPMVLTVGGIPSPAANLLVSAAPPDITGIQPNPVPLSSNPQTVTFTGSGFQSGLALTLYNGNNTPINVPAASINVISSTQFTAQFTTGSTSSTWTAIVTNPNGVTSNTFTFTPSGTAPVPTITTIVTTSSNAPSIAQNTWIEVHGANLATVSPLTWTSYFSATPTPTSLPTTLGGVTATVDGKSAAIFYVSSTQINILSPLDSALGTVQVVVNGPYGQATGTVTEGQSAPAFLVDVTSAGNYVAAEHFPSYALLGPTSMDAPGYTFTPASPGEEVILYATGFGQTTPVFANQLTTASPYTTAYNLPTLPTVTIGNLVATVSFAGLVAPGLYQFNVTVPTNAPAGDNSLVASYNGISTQNNVLITIQ